MIRVSIIIATYNRIKLLLKALDSILTQEASGISFEVLVIDNNSTDSTRIMVESIANISEIPVKYFFEGSRGKGFALNKGIKEAQGEILVFTDDDVIAHPYWLKNIVECFDQYGCDSVGGRVLPDYPSQTPSWVIDNAKKLVGPIVCYDYGEEVKPYRKKLMYEFLGANMAIKKAVFDELGLFLTDIGPGKTLMGEDTQMLYRLSRAQKNLYYCGSALVWHPVDPKRMTLGYIAKWNMCLGLYRVIADERSMPANLKYFFGFPPYLLKIIAGQIGLLFFHVFDRNKFLDTWIELFINVGKLRQIKRFHMQLEKGAFRHELFCQCDHLHV
jgi:glycosyltransferase involved in cell wall biosynthesis